MGVRAAPGLTGFEQMPRWGISIAFPMEKFIDLGWAVDAKAPVAAKGAFGPCADDGPAAALDHLRQGEFRRQEHPHEIDLPQAPRVLLGEVGSLDAARPENAGVIVEDVQGAIGLDRFGDDPFRVLRLRNIGGNENDFAAVRADFFRHGFALRDLYVAGQNLRTLLRPQLAGAPAKTHGAARYDCYLAVQTPHNSHLSG